MMVWKLGELIRLGMLTPLEIEQRGEKWFLSFAMWLMVLAEICLCALIITRVAYTEIDWVAYMQEVKGFLGGERNYLNLRGDTGPLVYPAGFLYLYSGMYWLSSDGEDILTAQCIFLVLYVSLVGLVLAIYRSAGGSSMPLWSLLLVCASRRVHSIFVLRMFNDGMAMWLLYAATYFFLLNRWRSGCVLYSLGVGVKMNILLFAPGLLLLLLQANGFAGTIICLTICAGVQLLLGAPFLLRHPVAYLMRSFELGRVFMYKWTVNLKFVDEETFVSPIVSRTLLALTVVTLGLFAAKWLRVPCLLETDGNGGTSRGEDGREPEWTGGTKAGSKKLPRKLPPGYLVKTLFVSNFIGVVFCRSLHYQFYAWYYHTLPFLLWQTDLPIVARLIVLGAVEYSFNVFPATPTSSLVLQASHFVLLTALWIAPVSRDTKGSSTARPKEA